MAVVSEQSTLHGAVIGAANLRLTRDRYEVTARLIMYEVALEVSLEHRQFDLWNERGTAHGLH